MTNVKTATGWFWKCSGTWGPYSTGTRWQGPSPIWSGVAEMDMGGNEHHFIFVMICGECWGLALKHRWLWWNTLPVLWEVLQYTTGWVKRNHWEQREASISDHVPWNHPWIKFTRRNTLKGKATIVKTTPYQCNTSMYQGRGQLKPSW